MFKLNGQYISNRGLVLQPGEHYYLDRYLDDKKRFKFSTYEIPNTKSAKKAIEKNGLVEIEFYQEQIFNPNTYTMWYGTGSTFSGGGYVNTTLTNSGTDTFIYKS